MDKKSLEILENTLKGLGFSPEEIADRLKEASIKRRIYRIYLTDEEYKELTIAGFRVEKPSWRGAHERE